MAEAVGLAASVTAIIDLSAEVAVLCLKYSTAAGNTGADVIRLQSRLEDLGTTLQGVKHLLGNRNNQALATSRTLIDSVDGCTSELVQLQSRLEPGKARKTILRFGTRALKWPFDSKEVSDIVSNLEHHERTITLSLQIDTTTRLLDIGRRIEGVSPPTEEDASIARKPCFSMPFERDPDFVDRPDITAWMREQYTGPAGRMALVGMSGFGKSQVAIEFAHYIRDTSPQTSVFWVHASSKSRFEEAYRSIADNLRLPRRNDPTVDVLGQVRDWLQREEAGPWLMVLDNVDDVSLFYPSYSAGRNGAAYHLADENPAALGVQRPLAVFLPKRRNGIILVTSRSKDAAEKLTGSQKAVYGISAMDGAQALQLFRNTLQGDFDENAAAELLRALDYIPLAITQAAAYINRRAPRMSVEKYLDAFQESDKKMGSLLNSNAGDLRRDETVSNSVLTTWQATFEQIRRERPSASDLLSLMSFFNPKGIPEFVLHNYEGDMTENATGDMDNKDNDEFEEDLDFLRRYSLVFVSANRDICEMYSLVQACTRVWLSTVDNVDRWKRLFLWTMSRHFPNGTFETWPTCQMLLPHVESILEEEPPEKDLEQWANLLTNCAWYLVTTGSYKAAAKLGEKVVKTSAYVLGEEHPDTLNSIANLALTYRSQGRWKEAEELEVQVMETRKIILGEEHLDTLNSIANLASIYRNQGRWEKAEELEAQVMDRRKTVLGEEHLDTLNSIANLASIYRNQGRWEKAEELEVQVVETRKIVLGDEHPDTLNSIANLALTYRSQGRLKEAEELEVQVMEMKKIVPGEEHPDMLASMANLASTYRNQGQWKKAEGLEGQVIEMSLRVLGRKHPNTLNSMANLASIHRNQGRWEKAEELEIQVVKMRKIVLGDEHPDTLNSIANLALTYRNQGRRKEAEELEVHVMEMRKIVLGEEHPDMLTSMANLASTKMLKPSSATSEVGVAHSLQHTWKDNIRKHFSQLQAPDGRFASAARVEPYQRAAVEMGLLNHEKMILDTASEKGVVEDGFSRDFGVRKPPRSLLPAIDFRDGEDDDEASGTSTKSIQGTLEYRSQQFPQLKEDLLPSPWPLWVDAFWYTLMWIFDPPPKKAQRITYICGCGDRRYLDVKELLPGAAAELQRAIRADATAILQHSPSSGNSTSSLPTYPSQAHLPQPIVSRGRGQGAPIQNLPSVVASGEASGSIPFSTESSTPTTTSRPKYLLLCVNTKRGLVKHGHINVSSITNDQFLFQDIFNEYSRLRRGHEWNLRALFPSHIEIPLWISTHLRRIQLPAWLASHLDDCRVFVPKKAEFVRFQLMSAHTEIVAGNFVKPDLPGVEEVKVKMTYDYSPCPQNAQIVSIPFFHELLKPGEHLGCFWWKRFPKKLGDMLAWNEDLECLGWGVYIDEGWNKRLVSFVALLLMILFGGFVTIYSVLTRDGSTGAGIGSFMMAVLTLFCWLRYEGWKSE